MKIAGARATEGERSCAGVGDAQSVAFTGKCWPPRIGSFQRGGAPRSS